MGEWSDETAEWYAEKYGEYPTNKLGLEGLIFQPGDRVVDLGCGTACALRHLASANEAIELLGVDPMSRMVELAKEAVAKAGHQGRIRLLRGQASLGKKEQVQELEARLTQAGFQVLESEEMEGHGVSLQRWICAPV